ncbi:MAG: FMN-binding protein [Bacteroidota bacterium]
MKLVIQMLVTLSVIGIVSGALLSELSGWAKPKIEAHRKAATEKAIFLVQPEADKYKRIESVKFEIYEVYDHEMNIGYALPYSGSGFQGNIRLMVGLDSDLEMVTGLRVLEQVETPGLGTKVTEKFFTDQFYYLLATPSIECVKGAKPSKDNEIEAITGATISSKAIVRIINNGMSKLRSLRKEGKL